MKIHIGVKTDPIEYRYSFQWLFSVLSGEGIEHIQLGSFFELHYLEDGFFTDLRELADRFGVVIKSVFTTHRELGGFFTGNPYLERSAEAAYKRHLDAAALVGADFAGGNPGAVYRDNMEYKAEGSRRYLNYMKRMMDYAAGLGLSGLTIEPMSSLAEPPSTPDEIRYYMEELSTYHRSNPENTVPAYLCGDVSHGLADEDRTVVYSNYDLFEIGIPYMAEFHFKNTDECFNSTFGFSDEERRTGIVDLERIKELIFSNADKWQFDEVVGYYETSGPKLGRDYSDPELKTNLVESIRALRKVFG